MFPAVTDKYITMQLPRQATNVTVDKESLNKVFSSLLNVIKYYYKDAEISYTNRQESIGDISFNGDIVTVTFDQETISNILGDMADVIADSDLKDSLSSNSILGELVAFLQNEQNYIYYISDSNCYLDFTTYVNPDGTIAGNKIKYRENHRSDKKSFDYLYMSNGSKYALYSKINGIKMIDVRVDRKNNTSGNAEIRLALSSVDTATLFISYDNYAIKKLYNLSVPTGNYSITADLSDNFISSLSTLGLNADMLYGLREDPITLTLGAENDSYKIDMEISSIAKITAETMLSEDTEGVSKGKEAIDSADTDKIAEFEDEYSEYIKSLDDPLYNLINQPEQTEEINSETSASEIDYFA